MLPQAVVACAELTAKHLDRIDAVHCRVILVVGMKVRTMVRNTWLRIHANNNTEKTSKFGQDSTS